MTEVIVPLAQVFVSPEDEDELGWQDQALGVRSRLPAGLPIGVATQVNDPGDALVKVIQVTPLVDLDAFSHVLVPTARSGGSG